jgi:hypothetical protein
MLTCEVGFCIFPHLAGGKDIKDNCMPAPSCKICNAITRPLKDNTTGKIYHVCDACEFISLDQKFILSTADEKRRYEFHNNTFDNAGYVAMFERFIAEVIEPHCSFVTSALDFGCGTTPVLAVLMKRTITRVDHYDPYFYPDESFRNNRYDLITTTEVIEHLSDPMGTFTMLRDLLNHGGGLAVMTKFHPCNDDEFLKWWYRIDDTHIAFYTKRTIGSIAGRIGLTVDFMNGGVFYLVRRT